jgi:hypothetical protein
MGDIHILLHQGGFNTRHIGNTLAERPKSPMLRGIGSPLANDLIRNFGAVYCFVGFWAAALRDRSKPKIASPV